MLRTGWPSPRIVDLDRLALRASVLVALIATGFVAGPEKYARIAAAFDWRFDALQGKGTRVDAWIDPPAYTGKPPLVLSLGGNKSFTGSEIPQPLKRRRIRLSSFMAPRGALDIDVKGALVYNRQGRNRARSTRRRLPLAQPRAAPPLASQTPMTKSGLILHGDATLSLGRSGTPLGTFDIHAILDQPPSIALTAAPKFNARGSMTLKYSVADDYGVTSAEANFAKPVLPGGHPAQRSLVDPPKLALAAAARAGARRRCRDNRRSFRTPMGGGACRNDSDRAR